MTREVTLSRLVKVDHQIEAEAEDRALRLMEHRWKAIHEHGFGVREYAKAIGRSDMTVRKYAKAWELVQKDKGANDLVRSPADYLEMAIQDANTFVAAEAIAQAEGIGVAHVRQSRMPEVRRVREAIADVPPEQKAERAQRYVEVSRHSAEVRDADNKRRRANTMQSVIDLEFELDKAKRALRNAVVISRDADFASADLRERIIEVLAQVRLLTEQLSMQIAGRTEVDWDAEAMKLMEAES